MNWKNTEIRWGPVSQVFHWLVVLLIIGQGVVGLLMGDMRNGPDKIGVYALHKSFGLTVLALATLRLAWRWYAGTPRTVAGTPAWQEAVARVTHWALYALLFAIPISGWVLNSASGFPLQWFGLVDLPALAGRDHALHEQAEDLHELLFWVLAGLALLHAAAAGYHHVFRRDDTLARMLPAGWSRMAARDAGATGAGVGPNPPPPPPGSPRP